MFQSEWDALALESFDLRAQLHRTRQELSTALYQNDAAVRVIARLTRERDEAREALSKVGVSAGGAEDADGMAVDGQGLSEELVAKVEETHERLVLLDSMLKREWHANLRAGSQRQGGRDRCRRSG